MADLRIFKVSKDAKIEAVKLKNLVNDRDHVAGAPNTPVTLVEYGTFEARAVEKRFQ